MLRPKCWQPRSLEKVKALADVFRPYGIKVYLSVNFASPIQLGKLDTADPLDKEVIRMVEAESERNLYVDTRFWRLFGKGQFGGAAGTM